MFSANENIQLRQHKRRIVQAVEATMDEDVLDLGVNVMVMQVACQDPGCVPIETAVIIVFPASDTELIPGLPQSAGGSFKTKILKPMANVETPDDVLQVLPPQFKGGLRTMERLAIQLRDVVLAQINQLAGADAEATALRGQLAEYLQASLVEYVQHDCVPPPLEEHYPDAMTTTADKKEKNATTKTINNAKKTSKPSSIPATGNYVMRRPAANDDDDDDNDDDKQGNITTTTTTTSAVSTTATASTTNSATTTANTTSTNTVSNTTRSSQQSSQSPSLLLLQPPPPPPPFDSVSRRRQQAAATRNLLATLSGTAVPNHARGIRRVGCPCCDPDNPSNVVDQMMQL